MYLKMKIINQCAILVETVDNWTNLEKQQIMPIFHKINYNQVINKKKDKTSNE